MLTRRTKRQSSNVFHMLNKQQIVELRDAFNLFDTDNDGRLTVENLSEFLKSIGSPYSQQEISDMVEELAPNYNFMMFLTTIGEQLSGISDLQTIIKNFKNLDENNTGKIGVQKLRKILSEVTENDFEKLTKGCIQNGEVDYSLLAVKIKYGEIIEDI
ncbi:Myosin [Nucleospora cyclopteri]